MGELSILNVGHGDMKLTFDKHDDAEAVRARRVIVDMIRRGYALLVEVERKGEKRYERALAFDEKTAEYIIADFDPVVASEADTRQIPEAVVDELSKPDALPRLSGATADSKLCHCGKPLHHRGAHLGKAKGRRRLPMASTRATAVGRSAGG